MKRVTELMEKYPDMPVEIMVDNDEICDGHRFSWHRIESVRVCPWIEEDDLIFTNYGEYTDHMILIDAKDHIKPENSLEKRIVIFTGAA